MVDRRAQRLRHPRLAVVGLIAANAILGVAVFANLTRERHRGSRRPITTVNSPICLATTYSRSA
jgi:hypothetical protein